MVTYSEPPRLVKSHFMFISPSGNCTNVTLKLKVLLSQSSTILSSESGKQTDDYRGKAKNSAEVGGV